MSTENFIFVHEDGTAHHLKRVTQDDMEAVDGGMLDIFDISIPDIPLYYGDGDWHELHQVERGND